MLVWFWRTNHTSTNACATTEEDLREKLFLSDLESPDEAAALHAVIPRLAQASALILVLESVCRHRVLGFGERRIPDLFVTAHMIVIREGARLDRHNIPGRPLGGPVM